MEKAVRDKTLAQEMIKALSKEIGKELQEVRKSTGMAGREQALKLINFAIEHKFVISPVGYNYYIDAFNQLHACPCDSSRDSCPCEQAKTEIIDKGHCLCHLFWRDLQTYKESKFK